MSVLRTAFWCQCVYYRLNCAFTLYDNITFRLSSTAKGVIITVAGDGVAGSTGDGGQATAAQLSFPQGVAVDASGNLYIADTSNHRIRLLTLSTGVITTVAGRFPGYNGDGGQATSDDAKLSTPQAVAVDASGNLYISDTGNGCIRLVVMWMERTIPLDLVWMVDRRL
jgi:streptogramin lyase